MRRGLLLLAGTVLILLSARFLSVKPDLVSKAHGLEPESRSRLGSTIAGFHLTDFRGREWTLQDFQDKPIVVIAFLGTECPLAKLYSSELVRLEKRYAAKGVAFIAVDANVQDSLAEMASHARKHEIEFPFLKDPDQYLADQLGATRTPEVCILDQRRSLRYRGRIDDQYGIGYTKKAAQTHSLQDALNALLEGREITTPEQPSMGCTIGRRKKADEKAAVTYGNQIAPILQERCVECHREGEIGPMSFTDPDEVSGWASMIAEVVKDERMPPWHASPEYGKFSNDRRLSQAQHELINRWVESGAPLGDISNLPKPEALIEGWQLPRKPDLVLNISPVPVSVPATGDVKYQYFKVDPGLDTDVWIEAAELLPGNRAVVHHILAFARPKGSRGDLQGERGFLFGYVPGTRVQPMLKGMAKKIPAGSELIFQVHYTPIGTPQKDQSKLGIVFADRNSITHEIKTTSAVQVDLRIPPSEANYRTQAMLPEKLPECQLVSMSPHMHLRGKSFRYTLVYPDQRREIILDIPKYDFNWQTEYRLAELKRIPEGTRMFCEAVFDNSEQNLNNPDPTARVRWGDQTYEEMMIGYFHIAVPIK